MVNGRINRNSSVSFEIVVTVSIERLQNLKGRRKQVGVI